MEQRLVQSQSQQLILSPQLRQYLKLLQLPLLDLQMQVQEELAQNPTLEETASSDDKEAPEERVIDLGPQSTDSNDDPINRSLAQLDAIDESWGQNSYYQSTDLIDEATPDAIKKHNYRETILTAQPTLSNYLEWQLGLLSLKEKEREIVNEIIGNINDDGYFVSTVEEVAQTTKSSPEEVERVLQLVQTLDPPGAGGRNLSEVLLIQLNRKGSGPLPKKIVQHHLSLLQKKQIDALAATLSASPEHVSLACQTIAKLEPKPGRIFYQNQPITVVPDVIITLVEDEDGEHHYDIEINHEVIPELRVNQKYRQMLKQKNIDSKTKTFLREKIQSALILIRALSERKSTLRQIAEELVKIQKDFLDHGFSHLKPLRLKDLAEKLGIHESTISRGIHEKYVQCPQGTIPLKSFFSSSMTMTNGTIESQKSLIEKVRSVIESEDKRKPLSDAQIMTILKHQGIDIARRTAAKYRELLKILPTHLRKMK